MATDKGIFRVIFYDSGSRQGTYDIDLLSRQRVGSNFVALNNKLVFINGEGILMSVKGSEERRGFVDVKSGKNQQEFYRTAKSLVYRPIDDAFYSVLDYQSVHPRESGVRIPNTFSMIRAVNVDDQVKGFSTYSFNDPDIDIIQAIGSGSNGIPDPDYNYFEPKHLFVDGDDLMVIGDLKGTESVDRSLRICRVSGEDDFDFDGAIRYWWESTFSSNPLIFNNLSGLAGSLLLIRTENVALYERGVLHLSIGPELGEVDTPEGKNTIDYPITVSDDSGENDPNVRRFAQKVPLGFIPRPLTFRQCLYWTQRRLADPVGDPMDMGIRNLGTIYGFQALVGIAGPQV